MPDRAADSEPTDPREHAAPGDWRPLYPYASYNFDAPGGRLHYIDERSPPGGPAASTLLFVHGNPTWSFHWRELIRALAPRHRCVAIDHLGMGQSARPDRFVRFDEHVANLAALVDVMQLQRVTLVAQDWGGAIGLGAMLRQSDRLEQIVLFNTGAFPPRYIPWRVRACRLPLLGRLAVQGGNLFSRAALRMTLARRRLEPSVAAGYLAPYGDWASRRGVYNFVQDIPTRASQATWQSLAEIERRLPSLADRPALLIWGMRDWCFRPDCLERFLAAWPNAEVQRLADVGHWVVEDAPQESLELVEHFLARSSPRPLEPVPQSLGDAGGRDG